MSARYGRDLELRSWLAAERPTAAPEGLLDAVVRDVAATDRRPAWAIADRWAWRYGAQLRIVVRFAAVVAIVSALIALTAWVIALGARRPAPPFGLTRAGLITFDTSDGIVVSGIDGAGRRVIVPPGGQSVSPTWSRDGLQLAYWHRADAAGPWTLIVVDPDGSASSVVADGINLVLREQSFAQPSNIAWSPDSRRIAFAADVERGQSVFVASADGTGVTRITDPALLAFDPAWSPDGRVIAYQSDRTSTLHVVAPDGSNDHELNPLPYTVLWPDWSPDGSRIATMAFVPSSDRTGWGQHDIFVVSADGSTVTDVSNNLAEETSPSWSPDGSRLAWARAADVDSMHAHIVVARPATSTTIEIRVDADFAPPVWSPDGTRLFSYVFGETGFNQIVVIDPDGVAPAVYLSAPGEIGNSNWQRLP